MRRIAALAFVIALTLLASACFGSSGGSPTASPPTVDWTIRYAIGQPAAEKAQLSQHCPAAARCTAVKVGGTTFRPWYTVVTRTVSCPRGAARSPDCRAIAVLRRTLGRRASCPCALRMAPTPSVTATVDGRRVRLSLDFCCQGVAAAHAADTLERA
jgi:hypothetical protein